MKTLSACFVTAVCMLGSAAHAQSDSTEISQTAPSSVQNDRPIPLPTDFVNLADYSTDFVLDMKYATTDNFLNAAVYDCAECYLRRATMGALLRANEYFKTLGYRIKIFDCYRPLDIQKRMWQIVPNPRYVANPEKGSIHNRGGAVDITLVDAEGNELDMGTPFDHFGPESAGNYGELSRKIKSNRKLLQKGMERSGFKNLASEWWHFDLKQSEKPPVANFSWPCD